MTYDTDREDRIEKTRAAASTLPKWPWARFDDPGLARRVNAKILAAAREWAPSAGNLLLLGPTGAGKTSATVAIAHRLLDAAAATHLPEAEARWARGLRFVSAHELIAARKERRLGAGEAPLVRTATDAALVILDELGFEPADSVVLEVADARYKANRITIATSGLTEDGFARRYGDAVLRRLSELGSVVSTHDEGAR